MEKKKKVAIGIIAVAAVAAAAGICVFLARKPGGSGKDKVYVEKVSDISGAELGVANRYAGIVEAQESWKISKDSDKEVKEVFVQAGDEVKEGDKLFSYDTEETAAEIEQGKLEMESINNEINDYNAQIAALSAERDAAPEDAKFDYTTQIQSVQNDLKQTEYNRKSKQLEIDKLNEKIAGSVVTSKMNGVVKSISGEGSDENGDETFITILATGTYRVKCLINEQNMSEIVEGSSMLIRSRVDEKAVWKGSITGVDKEAPQTNMNEYESSSDDTTTSSKYPFYVSLEHSEGLMLGQHVYVENDGGQGKKKEGIWLLESYLVMDGEDAYVWADDGKGKLEKRKVKLGKYDEELGEYKIKSGLKKDDLIAWPMENMYEGIETVKDMNEVDYDSPLYQSEEESGDTQEGEEGGGEDLDEKSEDMQPSEDVESFDEEQQDDLSGEETGGHMLQGEEL